MMGRRDIVEAAPATLTPIQWTVAFVLMAAAAVALILGTGWSVDHLLAGWLWG
jgi:hypothetical protein